MVFREEMTSYRHVYEEDTVELRGGPDLFFCGTGTYVGLGRLKYGGSH